ncbi:hypothetical protein V9L05_08605 [Bernardetia sp. Wsw4-3y2]|uniref:hypothetical protein n=1 Tax=Bernardetia sp. Wsw4-3y2 TaxID=3127471 RepID=UPI0030CD9354
MRILKTIDSSSCQDRKQTVQNLQEDILYSIDSFAAVLINPTTDKDLTVFTEHDEEIIKLLPGQTFNLVKESTSKTYGKIKVSITDTTETTTPTPTTTPTLETKTGTFAVSDISIPQVVDLSAHFTANGSYITRLNLVSAGEKFDEQLGYENFDGTRLKEADRVFTFGPFRAIGTYEYVIIRVDTDTVAA